MYLFGLNLALDGGHVNWLRYHFVVVGIIFLRRKCHKDVDKTPTVKLQTQTYCGVIDNIKTDIHCFRQNSRFKSITEYT